MRKFGLFMLVAIMMVACSKPNNKIDGQAIRLAEGESSSLLFEGLTETKELKLVATQNWMVTVEEGCEWFVVEPMYGLAGDVVLKVSVEDYNGEEVLKGGFAVMAGSDSVSISVEQRSVNDPSSPYVYIPDDNFAAALAKSYDKDGDGRISKDEAAAVEEIICGDCNIASLEGIKSFTALKKLDCSRNVIEGELDLSGMTNLEEAYIHHNLFSSINLNGCSNLRIVEANDNVEHTEDYQSIFRTESIDLEGCGELLYLDLTDNNISSIDLSDCKKLQVLRMTWNSLSAIDVSPCVDLSHLYVRKNPLEGTLDLSANTKLVEVWCAESKLEGVNLSGTYPNLTKIVAYDSNIASLDLSRTPALQTLEAHSMKLTAIDVTNCPNLDTMWLKFNEVAELDVTKCTNLRELQIGYNKIKTLDLSKCTNLQILEVVSNGLESINLAGCSMLNTCDLSLNNLTEVDVKDCDMLFQINLAENKLKKFDVSGKEIVAVVNISMNEVEQLNVEGCPQLTLLYADNNKLTSLDLRRNTLLQEVALSFNSLEELLVDGLEYMYLCEFNDNNLERLNLKGCVSISELYVHKNPLAYLSVNTCSSLRQLDMRSTNMKSIDLSNNEAMSFLFATENPQLQTVFIAVDASYSTLSVDEHVNVYIRDASQYDDVEVENWGDEDINPWA